MTGTTAVEDSRRRCQHCRLWFIVTRTQGGFRLYCSPGCRRLEEFDVRKARRRTEKAWRP